VPALPALLGEPPAPATAAEPELNDPVPKTCPAAQVVPILGLPPDAPPPPDVPADPPEPDEPPPQPATVVGVGELSALQAWKIKLPDLDIDETPP